MAELLISGGLVLTAEPDVLTEAIISDGAVLVRETRSPRSAPAPGSLPGTPG